MSGIPYTIYFMPWLEIRESFQIGKITFWSYKKGEDDQREIEKRIENKEIRGHLEKFFDSFLEHDGKPIKSITVCSYQGSELKTLSAEEISHLEKVVNILTFIAIIDETSSSVYHDANNAPSSGNSFELREQKLSTDSDIMNHFVGNSIHSQLKIGKFFFTKPWTAGDKLWQSPDQTWIDYFNKCLIQTPNDFSNRIFRSLEWFKIAHTDEDIETFSQESAWLKKTLLMSTTFETLFKLKNTKSIHFAEIVDKNLSYPNSILEQQKIGDGKKEAEKEFNKAGWWAFNFYRLRNRVIHGDEVSWADFAFGEGWLTHLIVADLVFGELIDKMFFEKFEENINENTAYWIRQFNRNWENCQIKLKWISEKSKSRDEP